MAKQTINVGAAVNDGTGDKLRVALTKANGNFDDLYSNKEDSISSGSAAQYWRGDKTFQPLNIPAVSGLQTELDSRVSKGGITGSGLTTNSGIILGRKTTGSGAIENLDPLEVKTIMGLDNVSNTSDANKPVSTATKTALDGKEPTIVSGGAGQFYRGDKTFQDLNKNAIGLGMVDNTSDLNKPVSTATQTALGLKEDTIAVAASNPLTKFWRGDKTFQTLNVNAVAGLQTSLDSKLDTASLPLSVRFYLSKNTQMSTQVVQDAFTPVVINSVAKALTAATASTTYDVQKNGVSVGSIVFAAAATVGTITLTGNPSFVRGDIVDVLPPAQADTTLDRIAIVLHN